MKILALSAYHAQSHAQWLDRLMRHIDADWQVHTLPARYFSWRIRGNSLSWLERIPQGDYDVILATSMVDLATLKGIRPDLARLPCMVYFHENQFAYPPSRSKHPNLEPQLVNLYSALAANYCVFNSQYNYTSFISGVTKLMGKLPDFTPSTLADKLQAKSSVIPVPLENINTPCKTPLFGHHAVRLLWNHRWEYDKGPERLHAILQQLAASEVAFELVLTGESFRQTPPIFDTILQDFAANIVHQGYVENGDDYAALLHSCDVVLSTALHEFQGLAILEACAAGCFPVLPDRLSYSAMYPPECLYASYESQPYTPADIDKEAQSAVANIIALTQATDTALLSHQRALHAMLQTYQAKQLIPRYQALLATLVNPSV